MYVFTQTHRLEQDVTQSQFLNSTASVNSVFLELSLTTYLPINVWGDIDSYLFQRHEVEVKRKHANSCRRDFFFQEICHLSVRSLT